MATYKGKINLVDMTDIAKGASLFTWIVYANDIENGSDISASPAGKKYIGIAYNKTDEYWTRNPADYSWSLFQGKSIAQTKTYYAISRNGVVPPVEIRNLRVVNKLLTFDEKEGASFIIRNELLGTKVNNTEYQLALAENKISGVGAEWTEQIPEVPQGFYLWTKIVYIYSDGSENAHYSTTYHAKDGVQGPTGENAKVYTLKPNQTEILKFLDDLGNLTVSPAKLTVSLIKEDAANDDGYELANFNITGFSAEIYSAKTGETYPLPSQVITYENNQMVLNLEQISEYVQEGNEAAANIFTYEECILCLNYLHKETENKTYNINEFLAVRYGMSKDMAQLSVKANGIVASMQDSKLSFNSTGLTVQNGAFTIEKKTEQGNTVRLLYADNGNLNLVGNIYADGGYFSGELKAATGSFTGEITALGGSFTGSIYATDGEFKGKIIASSGEIGGFKIEGDKLISTETGQETPNIVLNGKEGSIIAENITLGAGAKIGSYISIGDTVQLKNVTKSTDSFIVVNSQNKEPILNIRADGIMQLGNRLSSITIDGQDGSIYCQTENLGTRWRISGKESYFNDVTVSGSIRASVLEYGETQAIGGSFVARPSSRIVSIEKIETNEENYLRLYLESTVGFDKDDLCRVDFISSNSIIHNYYRVLSFTDKYIEIQSDAEVEQGQPIINMGKQGSIGIGINGSINNAFIPPSAISVFEFDEENYRPIPKIVLGKFSDDPIYGYARNTYGLYAENVLLKGSLVTKTKTENNTEAYSGISTIYVGENVPKSYKLEGKILDHKASEILLWAGAERDEPSAIEESKFFVDRNGNMYAGSGYFEGTIITKSKIMASEIETAILRGSGDSPALSIVDADNGIYFRSIVKDAAGNPVIGENNEEIVSEIFEVTTNSLKAKVNQVQFNDNFKILSNGTVEAPILSAIKYANSSTYEKLALDGLKISYSKKEASDANETIKSSIDLSNGLGFYLDNKEVVKMRETSVDIKTPLNFESSVHYGGTMEYRPVYKDAVLVGYDLYIE